VVLGNEDLTAPPIWRYRDGDVSIAPTALGSAAGAQKNRYLRRLVGTVPAHAERHEAGLMSLREKYRRILSGMVPVAAAGVALLLGSAAPAVADQDLIGCPGAARGSDPSLGAARRDP